MKAKAKILITAATFVFVSAQAFTANSGSSRSDHFRFERNNPAPQDLIIENNYYYGDGDYFYDYYYASRIRRFHRPFVSYSYYNSYYTDCYWYTYEPSYWGLSIYLGSMWNPIGLTISFRSPFRLFRRYSYYYDPYPFYPVYNIIYRPRIVNRYYYNTWYGNSIWYHRPYYSDRYYYHNNYRNYYGGGYYSHSSGYYANNYRSGKDYRSNRIVPSRSSAKRDNDINNNVVNRRRRNISTNRAGDKTRTVENNKTNRTVVDNRKSRRNISPVRRTNRSNENNKVVTNRRRYTVTPNNSRNINRSENKSVTRNRNYVPSRNRTVREDYREVKRNSTSPRISGSVDTRRSKSYSTPSRTKRSTVKRSSNRSKNSSVRVKQSSVKSRSKASRSGSRSKSSSSRSSGRRR